jgi:hypothetical protein
MDQIPVPAVGAAEVLASAPNEGGDVLTSDVVDAPEHAGRQGTALDEAIRERAADPPGADEIPDGAPVLTGRWTAGRARQGVGLEVLLPHSADRAEEAASQLARVDRVVDRGDADAEALGYGGHRQEGLRPEKLELRSPQIRRNSSLERVSICSIGCIPWQIFDGVRLDDSSRVEGLRRGAKPCLGTDRLEVRFGTKGSQVRILSPRPSKPLLLKAISAW